MAITQVGTATTASSATSGTVNINKPSGVQAGDVLFIVGASNESNWDTLPSGITNHYTSTDANTPNNFRVYVWTLVLDGSEGSSFTFAASGAGSSGAPLVVAMSAWRGVDNVSPILHQSNADSGSSGEPASPANNFNQSGDGRVVFARSVRVQTSPGVDGTPSFSTATSGWSEVADIGQFSTGTVSYGIGLYAKTADTSSGNQTCPAVSCNRTESDNVFSLFCLKSGIPPTNADAGKADPAAAAYNASALLGPSAAYAALSAAAHNAGVLTGVAAENTGSASVTAQAYNASVVLIGVAEAGAQAHNASVAIGTSAEYAQATVSALGGVGYFGAPESRRWRIPAEDRTFRVPHEDRVWRIPSED